MTHELIIVSVFELDDMISMWMVYLQPSKFEQMIMVTHSKKKAEQKIGCCHIYSYVFPAFFAPCSLYYKDNGGLFSWVRNRLPHIPEKQRPSSHGQLQQLS